MAYKKRILIATILGLIAGLICVTGGKLMFGMTLPRLRSYLLWQAD
jgi:flagellar motor component MotA